MLQMGRVGEAYLNLEHVLGVTFGLHQWEDDEGAHEVPLAIVEMATPCGGVDGEGHAPVMYRFYGATALTLRAWLDERTTVIAADAEACPEPVWALEASQPWDGTYEGEDAPVHAVDPEAFDTTFQAMADLPYGEGEERDNDNGAGDPGDP